jgi:MtN3 and saliva related transmembrane protein
MLVVLTGGLFLWLCYGVLKGDWIIALANGLGGALSLTVLLCKIRDVRGNS